MMRWLLIGGTTEAREAYDYLKDHGAWILISSATRLGSLMFEGMDCQIHEGRLDTEGFEKLMREHQISHILDASHPYAVEVSKTVKEAADALSLPYYRYTRSQTITQAQYAGDNMQIKWCDDAADAAAWLDQQKGTIVLLTGVNTLKIYAEGIHDFKTRVYGRVLDTESSRKVCEELWEDANHYLCAKPPFTVADNLAFLQQVQADYMVTKDSGEAGGMPEKMAAAKAAGCAVVIIKRPEEAAQMASLDELEVVF